MVQKTEYSFSCSLGEKRRRSMVIYEYNEGDDYNTWQLVWRSSAKFSLCGLKREQCFLWVLICRFPIGELKRIDHGHKDFE